MKKMLKKIFGLSAITAVTLAAGFVISMVSFRLFGEMSANEMKLLFAVDVLSLIGACVGIHFFLESKRSKAKRQRELEARHNKRVESYNAQYKEINAIIGNGGFAA